MYTTARIHFQLCHLVSSPFSFVSGLCCEAAGDFLPGDLSFLAFFLSMRQREINNLDPKERNKIASHNKIE